MRQALLSEEGLPHLGGGVVAAGDDEPHIRISHGQADEVLNASRVDLSRSRSMLSMRMSFRSCAAKTWVIASALSGI